MAKRGRPRKTGARQPNGQLRRPTLAQLVEADRQQRMAETSVVMMQPHRRWAKEPDHPWLAYSLGRFCLRHGLRSELHDAAKEWQDTYRRWRAAKGIPDPNHVQTIGSGQGPSDATVEVWWRDIERVEDALREYGQGPLLAMKHLILDEQDLPEDAAADSIVGLRIIAVKLGRLPEKAHPFVDMGRMAA